MRNSFDRRPVWNFRENDVETMPNRIRSRDNRARHSCQIRPQQATYNAPPINRPIEKFQSFFSSSLSLSLSVSPFLILSRIFNFAKLAKLFIVVGKPYFLVHSRWVHESFCYTTLTLKNPLGMKMCFSPASREPSMAPKEATRFTRLNQFSSLLVPLVHVMRL